MTWILRLNDMRFLQIQITAPVAQAETREELEALLESERVKSYVDGSWGKSFRRGGPLEWFNLPEMSGGIYDVGTEEMAVEAALHHRRLGLAEFPHVSALLATADEGSSR